MKRQPVKPIYGKSQGAKSTGFNLDKGNCQKSQFSTQTESNSGNPIDRRSKQRVKPSDRIRRFTRSKPVAIASFPRTILKISIAAIVIYQGSIHTPIGRDIAARGSRQLANLQKNIGETLFKLDPKNASKKRQDNADNNFKDAWKRASGNAKDKD